MGEGAAGARRAGLSGIGAVVAALAGAGLLLLPLVTFRPNRIAPGDALAAFAALPWGWALFLHALVAIAIVAALLRLPGRLLAGMAGTAGLAVALGVSAAFLVADGNAAMRVAPASGFWLLLFAFALLVTDSLVRLRPGPRLRLGLLALAALAGAVLLWSGVLRDVSVLREYASRSAAFHSEARTHVMLSLGSLSAAALAGIPLGIACHRHRRLKAAILNLLNLVQTIPSLALFGLLIAPLSWIAANLPAAAWLGIAGIGFAPAFLALFLYSLLPIVANTLAGLEATPAAVADAARGMGMTGRQILWEAELPLALPVMLAGIRIVLVQNIGLATIAALIGGGGFGVFVFQGIGQAAIDLVLLGVIPTVTLAIASAIVLDALAEILQPGRAGPE